MLPLGPAQHCMYENSDGYGTCFVCVMCILCVSDYNSDNILFHLLATITEFILTKGFFTHSAVM